MKHRFQISGPGSSARMYMTALKNPDVVQISSRCETVFKSKETSHRRHMFGGWEPDVARADAYTRTGATLTHVIRRAETMTH
jgi:hypothetical protein